MNVKTARILIFKTAVFPDGSVFCLRNGGFYHIEAKRCRPTVYVFSGLHPHCSRPAKRAFPHHGKAFPAMLKRLYHNPKQAFR